MASLTKLVISDQLFLEESLVDFDLEVLVGVDVEVLSQILLILRPRDLMNLFKDVNDSFQFFLCEWHLGHILGLLAWTVYGDHLTGWCVPDGIVDFLKVVTVCLLDLVVLVSPIEVEGIVEALGNVEYIVIGLRDVLHGFVF